MKSDLDNLMAARGLDAVIVSGDEVYSAPLDYLTNGADITTGFVVKKRGAEPVLVANSMEIEEAAKSGLTVYAEYDLDYAALLEESGGSRQQATVGLWANALAEVGVESGRLGFYGAGDLNVFLEQARMFAEAHPAYEVVGETGLTLFDEAFTTKDAGEIARIRSVAERTSAVIRETWDFIAGHRDGDGTVVDGDGALLTIGDVKRFVRRALLERELEDTGMIFAQGRDAGFPHSRGEADTPLRTGQSIIFDLFPRELGGGYHHDMTRTWCIGHAPDAVQAAYDDVMEAFDRSIEAFGVGKPTCMPQEAAQDSLEAKGHPTMRSHPGTTTGYMHSLGHGVGLNIHEKPSMSHLVRDQTFARGNVITIEPGLYYPEAGFGVRVEDMGIGAHHGVGGAAGFGVRVEDMLYVDENGELVTLTDVPKDLVLPLRG